ncbi:DUF2332 family protein [Sulfitobacter sp. F26204]|uniref:DUF2332 domain-containing protein n=1 Tax=Sulfitobacter sp. F26204 TaxID=2996014 RepID=UPI00225E080D|nr:DUF2332 family protein [Sulfitobacter sp. F26204]MCX7561083.1 DUF2332 family protein [Sulfitobacter sp. F26204]
MTLSDAFISQAESCRRMGSPFMGQLLSLLAVAWPSDSALGRKVSTFRGDIGPAGHSIPLRIAGGLHALVLSNRAADLAAVYPPKKASDRILRKTVLAAIEAHQDFLLDWIDSPPQTNEVRRSAALIAGVHVAVQHFDMPIYLSELGASGGLNMLWDHYALEIEGQRFGAKTPAVLFTPQWQGPCPPHATPVIAERAGVDLNPLDPSHPDHLLRMMAYLWADQPERIQMTRAAAAVPATRPVQGDAIDWLAPRLAQAPQGHMHLIQHSVAWQYFPAAVQDRGRALIEAAGARATLQRPLAWLSMETEGDATAKIGAALTLQLWPGDLTIELGRADFHGRWVNWTYTG